MTEAHRSFSLATWNVNSKFSGKEDLVTALDADIVVLTEVYETEREILQHLGQEAWNGPDNLPGVAIVTSKGWCIQRILSLPFEGHAYIAAELVHAKRNPIQLLACCVKSGYGSYQKNALQAVETARAWLSERPAFLAGDFNMHSVGTGEERSRQFFERMNELELRSAWHNFQQESRGNESKQTYFSKRYGDFHNDYIFAFPRSITLGVDIIRNRYAPPSDHAPIIAEFSLK